MPDPKPTSGVKVLAHVHFAMTGSFPLVLTDLFFADDGLYVAEYAYVTPLFGLGTGNHRREAAALGDLYEQFGMDAALVEAERATWHSYDAVEGVTWHRGGRIARPKLAVRTADGERSYRLHADSATPADLRAAGAECGFEVEVRDGAGVSLRGLLARLLPGR